MKGVRFWGGFLFPRPPKFVLINQVMSDYSPLKNVTLPTSFVDSDLPLGFIRRLCPSARGASLAFIAPCYNLTHLP
ncbi:hypothetical protein GDO81_002963 [Engystomops pustulosus]|uniref:Uncharacterized protein n=1 Tax=Engystomops pustulosus TaxID=76066 RepID=A0AAV7DQL2_ENGPU|nr:hypothetical protein GDO81_002963 [Engystomops pustulosus]